MPGRPMQSGCESGKTPLAISVVTTGICTASATRIRSAGSTFAETAPPPTYSTGRSAARIASAAVIICWDGRAARACSPGCRPAGQPNANSASCRSSGMSISTGPGRPLRAMWNASLTMRGMSSARSTSQRVLDDRHRDAVDVRLLEGVGADQVRRHLAGDAHDRRRVQVGVGDRGDQVGRARGRTWRWPPRPCRWPGRSPPPCGRRPARGAQVVADGVLDAAQASYSGRMAPPGSPNTSVTPSARARGSVRPRPSCVASRYPRATASPYGLTANSPLPWAWSASARQAPAWPTSQVA